MQRGIISTISVPGTLEDIYECWEAAYHGKPFVKLLSSGTFPDSKHVVGSNRVDISAVLDDRTGRFPPAQRIILGASGQAIQIANLRFGFPETAGLL